VVTPSEIPKGSAEHSILGGRSKWDWVTPVLDVDQGKADMVKAILSERKRREGSYTRYPKRVNITLVMTTGSLMWRKEHSERVPRGHRFTLCLLSTHDSEQYKFIKSRNANLSQPYLVRCINLGLPKLVRSD